MRSSLLLFLLLFGCAGGAPRYGTSLLGEPLRNAPAAPEIADALQSNLEQAEAEFRADPDSEEAAIWLGRRLAYLGRYPEAIETYSAALDRHPGSYRLLRHRGHRFLTTRQLERAIADLSRAEALSLGHPDRVEPDGAPNPAGIPLGTDRGNILYHLGLAQYLAGDFRAAADSFERRAAIDRNADNHASTAYWRFLALRRLDLPEEALAATARVGADDELLENFAYRDLVLLFRGERSESELQARLSELQGASAHALWYGLGAWHLVEGREERAREVWRQLLEDDVRMDAFGFIAAEAELARPL